jgi:hypothetical protein
MKVNPLILNREIELITENKTGVKSSKYEQ